MKKIVFMFSFYVAGLASPSTILYIYGYSNISMTHVPKTVCSTITNFFSK